MSMQWKRSTHGKKVLHVAGPFDFSRRREFTAALRQHQSEQNAHCFDMDLSDVTHIDTAGLGMLLTLRRAQPHPANNVALLNCQHAIKDKLYSAQLHQHFLIA
jgi:anti-anti-sigma factor